MAFKVLLDVCSRADILFDAPSSKVAQKRLLLDFVLTNITLDGEKLDFTLKEPFDVIAEFQKSQDWYAQWIKGGTPCIRISCN